MLQVGGFAGTTGAKKTNAVHTTTIPSTAIAFLFTVRLHFHPESYHQLDGIGLAHVTEVLPSSNVPISTIT